MTKMLLSSKELDALKDKVLDFKISYKNTLTYETRVNGRLLVVKCMDYRYEFGPKEELAHLRMCDQCFEAYYAEVPKQV